MEKSERINIVGQYKYDMCAVDRIRRAIDRIEPKLITLPYAGEEEKNLMEREDNKRCADECRAAFSAMLSYRGVKTPERQKHPILLAGETAKKLNIPVAYLQSVETARSIYDAETPFQAIEETQRETFQLLNSSDLKPERLFLDTNYTKQYIDQNIYRPVQEHITTGEVLGEEHDDKGMIILNERAENLMKQLKMISGEGKILHFGTLGDLYSTSKGNFYDLIIRLNGDKFAKPQRYTLSEFD